MIVNCVLMYRVFIVFLADKTILKRWRSSRAICALQDLSTNIIHPKCSRCVVVQEYIVYTRHKWVFDLKWWRDQLLERHSGQKDYCVEYVSDVWCVGVFLATEAQLNTVWTPEDKSEPIVCDVAFQSKSAGFCPAYPSLFTGTAVTISNFKVC